MEVVDNIADYGHLSPIHGSTVARFENEFKGHNAIQRQCGGHRTLVGEGGASSDLHTDTWYHGPGILVSKVSGMFNSFMMIMHTPIEDGKIKVWHNLLVKTAHGGLPGKADVVAAKQFQEASRLAFAQDFEVWSQKAACPEPAVHPQRRRLPQGPHLVQAVLQPSRQRLPSIWSSAKASTSPRAWWPTPRNPRKRLPDRLLLSPHRLRISKKAHGHSWAFFYGNWAMAIHKKE